jgi:hypothetical protein
MVQLLEDVLDNIEDATDGGAEGEDLSQRSLVEGHLATALSRIDEALRVLGDAGVTEGCEDLASLDDIAQRCVDLAQEALEIHELAGGPPAAIAGKLRTIRELVTGSNGHPGLTRPV